MTEFLHRRRQQVAERRPLAQQVTKPAAPEPTQPPIAVQERPAIQIGNRREVVGTQLIIVTSQDATRRGLRFRNWGPTTIYLGGPGVTNETACHRLLNGDFWEETLAAGAQWFAVSDAAGGVLCVEEIR